MLRFSAARLRDKFGSRAQRFAQTVSRWPVQKMALTTLGLAVAAGSLAGALKLVQPAAHGPAAPGGYKAASTEQLRLLMRVAEMDLAEIRAGRARVPRLLLERLPADFAAAAPVEDRQSLFIAALLPLILAANEEIAKDRRRVQKILANPIKPASIDDRDAQWLAVVSERYGADPDDPEDLLRRLDTISPAIALAQAAQESGWGTSRFAHAGNALFGQRVWSAEAGLAPLDPDGDGRFALKTFPNLLESVRAYALNLNSHAAYDGYRRQRAVARHEGRRLDPRTAVASLDRYSEEGAAYVRAVREIMADNSLTDFELVESR